VITVTLSSDSELQRYSSRRSGGVNNNNTNNMSLLQVVFVVVLLLLLSSSDAYEWGEETEYVNDFASMEARAWDVPLPADLITNCKNRGLVSNENVVTLDSGRSYTASEVTCSSTDTCVVPDDTNIEVDADLNVGALVVKGSVRIATSAWLCAGYISVEDSGSFIARLPYSNQQVYIYIKDNGLEKFGTKRFIRGSGSSTIIVEGAELKRTWSLLSETALSGTSSIKLMHDPIAMGWKIGDRVVIAPMLPRSTGNAGTGIHLSHEHTHTHTLTQTDACNIINIEFNELTLDCQLNHDRTFSADYDDMSTAMGIMSAEVIHMTRNIVITGDDLTIESCAGRNDVNSGVTKCTYGLHTMSTGTSSLFQVSYSRVEKCGQRGILGKYW
jgi:hypothetical protein